MSKFAVDLRAIVLAVAVLALLPGMSYGQAISESHLNAAKQAVAAAKASRSFDNVLPLLSEQTQNRLILVRPDLHSEIAEVVEKLALTMVSRRDELDNDIARVWARAFTEEELETIRLFYLSSAGIKLADIGPQVINDSFQAAKGWSDRIGAELFEKAQAELVARGFEF